ncbi:hypothetical protein [Caballeronia sp. TF1N1]|uniref:hypothetical protein n=1 Tax=Caballeronia sp. TF1N1 TaxID=2878153 RepID=UPI001FD5EF66|nr:hypothetical protein [Caballeronia sp. TF1N1]
MNPSVMVDQRFGTSYQVIKEVHAALAQILFLADNMDQLAPREIELQQSTDKANLQWRREGDIVWKNLVSLVAIGEALDTSGVQFGIADVADNKNYVRSQGVWKPLPTLFSGKYADLSGLPDLFSGEYDALQGKPTVLPDAPNDGKQYARKDGAWVEVVSSSGSGGDVGFTPLKIDSNTTFFVPQGTQAFLRMTVTVEGTLKLDGYLIEV